MTDYGEMEPPIRAEAEPFDGSEDSEENPADYEENGDTEMSLEGLVASLDDYSGTLVSGVDPPRSLADLPPWESVTVNNSEKDQQPPDLPPKQKVRNGDLTLNGHKEDLSVSQPSTELPVVPPRRNRKNFRNQVNVSQRTIPTFWILYMTLYSF